MNKPSINFKNFPSWNEKELNDFLIEYSNRNNVDLNEVVSIGKYGIRKRSDIYSKELSKDISKNKIITKDSMVIGMGSTQINIAILLTDNIYSVSPAYSTFKINNINSTYLNYFFNSKIRNLSNKYMIISARQGKTVDKQNLLKHREYFSNNLEEQQKISTFLSAFDLKIEHESQIIEQLKQLKKSLLYKMFPTENSNVPELRFKGFTETWEQRKLGEISNSYSGGTPTVGKKDYYGGNIPFIRSGEISCDKTELFITNEGVNSSSAKMVTEGDILYALYGATSGEVSISKMKGAINQAILAIQPHQNYDSQFIMQWLRKSKESIISTYLQGGQGNLSGNIVKELLINLPNYDEQKQIGDFFSKIDSLITLHQRKYDKLVQVKKALLNKMFV